MEKPKRLLIATSHDVCETCDEKCQIVIHKGKAMTTCHKLVHFLEAAGRIKGYEGVDPKTGEKVQILGLCG